jgi:hypothetical protein
MFEGKQEASNLTIEMAQAVTLAASTCGDVFHLRSARIQVKLVAGKEANKFIFEFN